MSYLGWFLAVGGLVGVIFGVLQMLKAKKMQTVPFKTPGEIAKGGPGLTDAKGLVSTEGKAEPGEQLIAPMSGTPCLGYVIKIERKWEKQEVTEKGTEKKTGTDTVSEQYTGSVFKVKDGAGSIDVDARKQPDVDMEKTHSSTVKVGMMIPGTLTFGQMQVNTPQIPRDSFTTAFVGTEKVLKPSDTMYALGALQGSMIGEPPGKLSGKLILSNKGRAVLLGKTKRNMLLGYIIGGVVFVGGTLLGIFGPAPKGGCSDFTGAVTCSGKIYNKDGVNLKWTVPKEGRYQVTVRQPNVKIPIDAVITLYDSTGKQIAYSDGGSAAADPVLAGMVKPGVYKLNIRDFHRMKIKGGFSYSLVVTELPTAAQPAEPKPAGDAPAAAEASAMCAKAVACCAAMSGAGPACDALAKAGDATCKANLKSMYKAAKKSKNKAAEAACHL
jgi:hypothetical protein